MLAVEELAHQYDSSSFQLGPIDFSLGSGDCVALLGENGAGKTTFFEVITGNLRPKAGTVSINGQRMNLKRFDLKRGIGYLPQHADLPRWVSGFELLSYANSLYKLNLAQEDIKNTLKFWDALDYCHKPIASLSHGMQKRIGLGLATIHTPQLLILDEPFSGLDIYHIKALKELINNRKKKNMSTIVCTHIAPYAAELCDKAFIIQAGKLEAVSKWEQSDLLERISLMEERF